MSSGSTDGGSSGVVMEGVNTTASNDMKSGSEIRCLAMVHANLKVSFRSAKSDDEDMVSVIVMVGVVSWSV